ncbi:MAG: (d)CMP kinase [Clostridia bacterium]|nr:(d)CMP kinase [Clostridia bacterium]
MIVAIDGPAGTGKGTIASLISKRLSFTYIDTGAMYRCVALQMIRDGIGLDADIEKIKALLEKVKITFKNMEDKQHVFLNGEDVSELIRTPQINEIVSPVSAIKEIRIKLVELQRELGAEGDVIMEGRDITTVVFPNAEVKIYLTADAEERAKRRYKELLEKGVETTYEETLESINKRDYNDMHKEMGALQIADGAEVVDTTNMSIEEVYETLKRIIEEKRAK